MWRGSPEEKTPRNHFRNLPDEDVDYFQAMTNHRLLREAAESSKKYSSTLVAPYHHDSLFGNLLTGTMKKKKNTHKKGLIPFLNVLTLIIRLGSIILPSRSSKKKCLGKRVPWIRSFLKLFGVYDKSPRNKKKEKGIDHCNSLNVACFTIFTLRS